MASAKVKTMDGREVGALELNDDIFNVELNNKLVHDVAVALMNAKRQGNAETKTRTQVRGGGKKPFKQKGTGNARQGSSREPHMKGGGVVFGPHKRSYRQSVPVMFKRKALCCMLSDRLRSENLYVLDAITCDAIKTKTVAKAVESLAVTGKKTLFVTAGVNKSFVLSSRNIPRVAVTTASDLNVLDILNAVHVFVAQDALPTLEERLK